MIKFNQDDILEKLKARADIVWGKHEPCASSTSKLLGTSNFDELGRKSWSELARVCFVAPNFYLNRENPNYIEPLNCLEVGADRDDRPLYYFLSTGHYALSSDRGLLFVANSSLQLFECFLIYGEWIEEIIKTYGSKAIIEKRFLVKDTYGLEVLFSGFLGKNYKDSFWAGEVKRLRELVEKRKQARRPDGA